MTADISVGVVGSKPRQRLFAMRRGAVDAMFVGRRQNVPVRHARSARGRVDADNAAAPNIFNFGRRTSR